MALDESRISLNFFFLCGIILLLFVVCVCGSALLGLLGRIAFYRIVLLALWDMRTAAAATSKLKRLDHSIQRSDFVEGYKRFFLRAASTL